MKEQVSRFADRAEAGRLLADEIRARNLVDPVVFALPRGGVPVAVEIARAIDAPMDLILVRKIGAPGNPELALAAIVEGEPPDVILNTHIREATHASDAFLQEGIARETQELERRRQRYLGNRPRLRATGRAAIVVDDGLATGATMKAALTALRRAGAGQIVLALPAAPARTLAAMSDLYDTAICLNAADRFSSVARFYDDFHQLEDDEVIALLRVQPAPPDQD